MFLTSIRYDNKEDYIMIHKFRLSFLPYINGLSNRSGWWFLGVFTGGLIGGLVLIRLRIYTGVYPLEGIIDFKI